MSVWPGKAMATLDELRGLLQARHNLADPAPLHHPDLPISHVTWDHREVRQDSLFLAKRGLLVDGHDFIPAAIAAGAHIVLGTESVAHFRWRCRQAGVNPTPYLQVGDSQQAYAQAAALSFDFPARQLRTVGITGTDGKTTSTALLAQILTTSGHTVGTISTLGITHPGQSYDSGLHITTPDAWVVQQELRHMVNAGCQYAVLECTSHGLAQHRVDETVLDAVGVTNVTHEHLDYHGTFEHYLQTKCNILNLLADTPYAEPMPVAILNGDDIRSTTAMQARVATLASKRRTPIQVRRYRQTVDDVPTEPVAYQASHVQLTLQGLQLRVQGSPQGVWHLQSRLLGQFNVSNILLAVALGHTLGVPPHQIRAGVRAFAGVEGRMQRIELGQDFLAIVDFAHSPGSLDAALAALRTCLPSTVRPRGRLITVFGCAGLRDHAKRQLMGAVSAHKSDYVIVTAEDPRTENLDEICAAIVEGIQGTDRGTPWEIVPDRAAALERAVELATAGDIVAAFGKGHERSMCFGETEYAWSDQLAMTNALRKRLGLNVSVHDCVYQLPTRNL